MVQNCSLIAIIIQLQTQGFWDISESIMTSEKSLKKMCFAVELLCKLFLMKKYI